MLLDDAGFEPTRRSRVSTRYSVTALAAVLAALVAATAFMVEALF